MMSLQFKKEERFYHVYLQHNFFGGITIVCSWGTYDSKRGNCKHIFCDDIAEVNNKLAEIKNTRHKKGYKIYCS
jgi:predicted DNA-binding WGR domain protein